MTLPHAVAARGLPVLHVNPEERLIGTVVVDGDPEDMHGWWTPGRLPNIGRRLPRAGDYLGRLVVCSIDDCRLDPIRGLVTPVMDEVAAEREARAERARPLQEEASRRNSERALALQRQNAQHAPPTEDPVPSTPQAPPTVSSASAPAATPPGPAYHCIQCAHREIVGLR